MFDIGFTELLLIGVVSLVVIGPERLPDVARTVGRWIGKLQRFVRGVKRDIANELDSAELKQLIGDQREQIDELQKMVRSTARELESSTQEVVRGARKRLDEMEDAAARAEAEEDADEDVTAPEKPKRIAPPSAGDADPPAGTRGVTRTAADAALAAKPLTEPATARASGASTSSTASTPASPPASAPSPATGDEASDAPPSTASATPTSDGDRDGGDVARSGTGGR